VATSQARVYYSVVSRLMEAGLPFVSLVPGSPLPECDLVLTTEAEASLYGSRVLPVEELDEDAYIFKGQILSRLDGGEETMLVGIDPGTRIGLAAYYGEVKLEFGTFGSVESLCARVAAFVKRVPARKALIRVGNGDPALAMKLVASLAGEVPGAAIEVVDEAGTSVRGIRMRGVQGDQRAAARIAFRKGTVLGKGSRTPR
jgi:hypothetical protein